MFLYFGKQKPRKTSYIFSKESFSYALGNESPEKASYISDPELFYISGNGKPKKPLIFQERTSRLEKRKKHTLKKFLTFRGNGTF